MSDTSVKQSAGKKKDGIGLVKLCVRLTLTEEALGTSSASKELHKEYIASKAPGAKSTEEEVAALGVAVRKRGMAQRGNATAPQGNAARCCECANPHRHLYMQKWPAP